MRSHKEKGSVLLKTLIVLATIGLLASIVIPQKEMRKKEAEKNQAHSDMLALLSFENRYFTSEKEYTTNLDTLQAFITKQAALYKQDVDELKKFVNSDNVLQSDSLLLNYAETAENLKLYFQYDRKEYVPVLDSLGRFLKYVGKINSKQDYYNSLYEKIKSFVQPGERSCLSIDKLQPYMAAADSLDFTLLKAKSKIATAIEDTLEKVLTLDEVPAFKKEHPKATIVPRDFVTAIDSIKHYILYEHFIKPCDANHTGMLHELRDYFDKGERKPDLMKKYAVYADSLKWIFRFSEREDAEQLGRIRGFLLFKASITPRVAELSSKFESIDKDLHELPTDYLAMKDASNLVDTLKTVFEYTTIKEGEVPYSTRMDTVGNYFYSFYSWGKARKDSIKKTPEFENASDDQITASTNELFRKMVEKHVVEDTTLVRHYSDIVNNLKSKFLNEYGDGEETVFQSWLPMLDNLIEKSIKEREREASGFSNFLTRIDELHKLFQETMANNGPEISRLGAKLDYITSYPPSDVPFFCPDFPGVRYKIEVNHSKVDIIPFDVEHHGQIREGEVVW